MPSSVALRDEPSRGGVAQSGSWAARTARIRAGVAVAAAIACLTLGCSAESDVSVPPAAGLVETVDALALSDALEALIAEGRDTPADREAAYDELPRFTERNAAYYFARAAITGRLVQQRGLRVANLVEDVEHAAMKSVRLDPTFRDGAAKRLLGTLYVIAPAALLKHGNSEAGLAILEELTEEHPDTMENHLRLAEAYISLGDPEPACPHLRRCINEMSALRPDEQKLLEQLFSDIRPRTCCPVADVAGVATETAPARK